jgi:hypothetical protein
MSNKRTKSKKPEQNEKVLYEVEGTKIHRPVSGFQTVSLPDFQNGAGKPCSVANPPLFPVQIDSLRSAQFQRFALRFSPDPFLWQKAR